MRNGQHLARRFRTPHRLPPRLGAGLLGLLLAGCSGTVIEPAAPAGDTTPPGRVTDLYVSAASDTAITLTWTAPGDDGRTGTATRYEIRRAPARITAGNWAAATEIPAPPPAAAGARETVRVTGLARGQQWWFALRAADEVPNWSAVSNVPSARAENPAGRTWFVRPDGSGDAPTIQAAIDSVSPGDLILLSEGRFTWTGQAVARAEFGIAAFPREVHDITLRSVSGSAFTTLDCEGRGRALHIQGDVDGARITIEGLTIVNGAANRENHWAGGGILAHLSACTLRDVVVTDCTALYTEPGDTLGQGGGLWYGGQSAPLLENCVFARNRANVGGGAMLINSPGETVFRDCLFADNRAEAQPNAPAGAQGGHGGGVYDLHFRVEFSRCAFLANTAVGNGGGLRVYDNPGGNPVTVNDCTFALNRAALGGGVNVSGPSDVTLAASIIAGGLGGSALVRLDDATLRVGCCDLFGNGGGNALPPGTVDQGGNFSLDPLFCDSPGGDVRLQPASPCLPGQLPAGSPCAGVGALAEGCEAK